MTAREVAFKTIHANEPDTALAKQLADAVCTALEREGWISHDSNDLAMMKEIRQRLKTAVMDPDCPARDLAALSRRLQDLNADILALEDRLRDEGRLKTNGSSNAGPTADDAGTDTPSGPDRKFDPTKV